MFDFRARLQTALADRYTIDREIGRGGMSLVFLARDVRHDRLVALKVLRPELAATLGPDRFLREIKVAAGLTHPHILPLFDSGVADGLLFYVMPYVEGESLRHRLAREGRLPLADAVTIASDVAGALAYAHTQNVVHRDIKPENILIEAGHAVISDFGIARAISAADESRVTGTGIAVGTVEYMSPEQASGEQVVDGRSDIYSLGCVLYEMLVGRTPFAGRTPTGVLGAHRGEPAPSVTTGRPGIPLEVELAIETALAKVPSERFATAGEFAAALRVPETSVSSGRWLRRLRRRWRTALVVAAATAAALALMLLPRLFASDLDASLYVVVPFGHRGGAAPALVNGDQCELQLSQAFGRWTDVRLADPLRVHDARMRRGEIPMTLDEARRLAKNLGAGMLVWGDVADVGDSIQVTAALYDLRRGGGPVRDYAVRIPKDGKNLEAKFRVLADSILLGGGRSQNIRPNVVGTDVLAAFYAYADGRDALARWDLGAAGRSFRAALESDPGYAQASLWLAHTEMWGGEPAADWRVNTARALASPQKLSVGDLALAHALWLLADRRFPQACAAYQHLVARDSTDFIAWFGLGECQRLDKLVVPDAASPSKWRFRASYRGAATAYRRALELLPSAHRAFTGIAVQRLMDLFFAETNVYRPGYAPGPDTLRFGAFPSLDHDTLAFIAWPIGDLVNAKPGSRPVTTQAAIGLNREELRKTILTWIEAFPASADAHEALGLVLETTGEVDPGPSAERSALAAVQRARALTRDPAQAIRTAVAETRLLFKLERFGEAAALADSTLAAAPAEPGPLDARRLAGLAVLTGRVYPAARLLRLTAPIDTPITWDGLEVPDAPIPVKQAGLALMAYASLGAPPESLRALKTRVDQRVSSWAGPVSRERMRLAVLHVPMGLAFDAIGVSDVHRRDAGGDYVLEIQWAIAHGDTAAARAELARQAGLRTRSRAGDVAIDGTYGEARVLLQLGDTAAAVALLDLSLQALPTLGTSLLEQPEQVGCALRAMALRAELASRAGDDATATRWARAVTTLWANADPPLEPVMRQMRALAGSARHD
ncbi:MAG TPA: serine/threonine-protein kinase [Gemmatimonadales bacterium]|nr:serine/threonine-protein kinase [Gemmatimonadales bacterium]